MTTPYRNGSDGLKTQLAELEAERERFEHDLMEQQALLRRARATAWKPTTIVGVVGALATVVAATTTWVWTDAVSTQRHTQIRADYERRLAKENDDVVVCPEARTVREVVEVEIPVHREPGEQGGCRYPSSFGFSAGSGPTVFAGGGSTD